MKRGHAQGSNSSKEVVNRRSMATASRRQFAKTMAVIAASPLLPRVATAMEPKLDRPATGGPLALSGEPCAKPADTIGDDLALQAPDADKIAPDAEALGEVVRIRYGKTLSDDQMPEVKRSINNRIRAADRLKQFKLANGDEPAFVFSPDPQ